MKTLLITGASGLCGRELTRRFAAPDSGWRVVTTSRRAIGREGHVAHDLAAPLPVGDGAFPRQVDAVIHAAAAVDERADDYAVINANLAGIFHAASYARAAGATAFVQLSSVAVYGLGSSDATVDEGSPTLPRSAYGLAKLLAEHVAKTVLPEAAVSNLRLSYVLGEGAPERYIVRRFANAVERGAPVTLVNPDLTRFQFIDTRDIAAICALILERGTGGDYIVAGDERPTVAELFETVRGIVGTRKIQVEQREDLGARYDVAYDNRRLKTALGGFAYRPYRESVAVALATLPQ